MNPIEAIADAIMEFEGWRPGSRSYRNRNPGNLEGPGGRSIGQDGPYRVYKTMPDGYLDLIDDLTAKFNGSHYLGPTATLGQLMNVYAPPSDNNPTTQYTIFVASWATRALGRTVASTTTLKEILDGPNAAT